ncbi:MAG: hypothetical protein M3Q03_12400 [Chloroflexota bacterium]|nr:hypothetical protein [Chloroflexota bacterium]
MAEVGRILVAVGSVMASVGLVVFGIAQSYLDPNSGQSLLGVVMMVVGLVLTVVGAVAYSRGVQSS